MFQKQDSVGAIKLVYKHFYKPTAVACVLTQLSKQRSFWFPKRKWWIGPDLVRIVLRTILGSILNLKFAQAVRPRCEPTFRLLPIPPCTPNLVVFFGYEDRMERKRNGTGGNRKIDTQKRIQGNR